MKRLSPQEPVVMRVLVVPRGEEPWPAPSADVAHASGVSPQ
jgi:hypothetical protein